MVETATKTDPVSLASLMTPSKTVEMEYPEFDGFEISLCYLAREELLKLRNKCVAKKFNRKTRAFEEDLDEDKFLDHFCRGVIKGWKGLKFSYLEELLLVDVSNQDPDDVLPYTVENAELLMKNSSDFDTWVTEVIGELENFTGNK